MLTEDGASLYGATVLIKHGILLINGCCPMQTLCADAKLLAICYFGDTTLF